MSTKSRILNLLEENKGSYLSGEDIARSLRLSRNSIWKAIKALKNEGYEIQASTNRGYCLSPTSDVVSLEKVVSYLQNDAIAPEVFNSIDSTNNYIKDRASAGANEGLLAIASEQTGGKGRRGRSFFSPEGTGIYFSLLLRPHMCDARRASTITTMAAVAVCESIREISGQDAVIKWVNDVFLNGKKICGILTEASFDLEGGFLDYAVLGIGINVYSPAGGFPKEIRDIAGAIFTEKNPDTKSRLVAHVVNNFMKYYKSQNPDSYKEAYRSRCFILGKRINVILPTGQRSATAVDLNNDCHLIVEYDDGTRETLSSGEVSIRVS